MNFLNWLLTPLFLFVYYLLPIIMLVSIPIILICLFPKGRTFLKELLIEIEKQKRNNK